MKLNKVLSLFDGMSCGQIALNKLSIKYSKYYASEIDKYAMQVTQHNYPDTIQLGDINDIDLTHIYDVDLLIGGSPCQNLSIAVAQNELHNQGLDGDKSKLFYSYLKVLHTIKPKYFLLENVASMKNTDKDIITNLLGVSPIMIDSSLVSAQSRKRLYWTNIPDISLPKDKKIILNDIVIPAHEVDAKYWYARHFQYNGDNKKIQATLGINGHDILKRVYNLNSKCATLTSCRGGNHQKKGVSRWQM